MMISDRRSQGALDSHKLCVNMWMKCGSVRRIKSTVTLRHMFHSGRTRDAHSLYLPYRGPILHYTNFLPNVWCDEGHTSDCRHADGHNMWYRRRSATGGSLTWAFCSMLFTSTTLRLAFSNFFTYGSRSRATFWCSFILHNSGKTHTARYLWIFDAVFEGLPAGPYLWPDRLYALLIPLGFFCKETWVTWVQRKLNKTISLTGKSADCQYIGDISWFAV